MVVKDLTQVTRL